jgi:anti-sigma B factor antagonist
MKIKHKIVDGVAVVAIHGKLIGGPEHSSDFHSAIRSLIEAGHTRLAINLGRTTLANSQGIGMLIGAYTSARKAGGDLVLARVLDRIAGILSVTRLYLIFRVFDTEAEAVAYLSGEDKGAPGARPGVKEDAPSRRGMRGRP